MSNKLFFLSTENDNDLYDPLKEPGVVLNNFGNLVKLIFTF